jgi:hypothetical protein
MLVIAVVAILLGLGATRRIDRQSRIIEILRIADLDSDRVVGLTESWEVWIRVVQAFPAEASSFLIVPSIMECDSRGPGVNTVVYLVPLEYVATLIIVLATTIVILVNYLSRWGRRATTRCGPDVAP